MPITRFRTYSTFRKALKKVFLFCFVCIFGFFLSCIGSGISHSYLLTPWPPTDLSCIAMGSLSSTVIKLLILLLKCFLVLFAWAMSECSILLSGCIQQSHWEPIFGLDTEACCAMSLYLDKLVCTSLPSYIPSNTEPESTVYNREKNKFLANIKLNKMLQNYQCIAKVMKKKIKTFL